MGRFTPFRRRINDTRRRRPIRDATLARKMNDKAIPPISGDPRLMFLSFYLRIVRATDLLRQSTSAWVGTREQVTGSMAPRVNVDTRLDPAAGVLHAADVRSAVPTRTMTLIIPPFAKSVTD